MEKHEVTVKPARLRPGDKVAAISLSSGLAAEYPHRYQAGKSQFQSTFDLEVVETPNALKSNDWLYRHPEARADDLHWALENPEVAGIISTIGGNDSVRILPHLDRSLIERYPKVFLGFSDSTVTHLAYRSEGVVSYYGPSLMTDLAENCGVHPYVETNIRRALFEPRPFDLAAAPEWTEEHLDWADPSNQDRRRKFESGRGWVWLQGSDAVEGRLAGGCVEVLEFIKGTEWWPKQEQWAGAVLCLETSEEVPPPHWLGYWLRNYGMQGVLERLSGLLLARARGYTEEMTRELYERVLEVLAEFGRTDLPVVANLDFGHTSPQMVLPLGIEILVDPASKRIALQEGGVA